MNGGGGVFGLAKQRLTEAVLASVTALPKDIVTAVISGYAAPTLILFCTDWAKDDWHGGKLSVVPTGTDMTPTLTLANADTRENVGVWRLPSLRGLSPWEMGALARQKPRAYVCPDTGQVALYIHHPRKFVNAKDHFAFLLLELGDKLGDARVLDKVLVSDVAGGVKPDPSTNWGSRGDGSVIGFWLLRPGSKVFPTVAPTVAHCKMGDRMLICDSAKPHPFEPDCAIFVDASTSANTIHVRSQRLAPTVSIGSLSRKRRRSDCDCDCDCDCDGDAGAQLWCRELTKWSLEDMVEPFHCCDSNEEHWREPIVGFDVDRKWDKIWMDTSAAVNTPWERYGGLIYVAVASTRYEVRVWPPNTCRPGPVLTAVHRLIVEALRVDTGESVGHVRLPCQNNSSVEFMLLSNGVLCVSQDHDDSGHGHITEVLWHPDVPGVRDTRSMRYETDIAKALDRSLFWPPPTKGRSDYWPPSALVCQSSKQVHLAPSAGGRSAKTDEINSYEGPDYAVLNHVDIDGNMLLPISAVPMPGWHKSDVLAIL